MTYAGGEGGAVKGSGTASPQDQVFPQFSHGKRGPACHQYSENQVQVPSRQFVFLFGCLFFGFVSMLHVVGCFVVI